MAIPTLDRTGKEYEASRASINGDVYYLMMSIIDPSFGGVEMTRYLTARLYKNTTQGSPLFPMIQMALDNLGNQMKTFQERWDTFVERLSKAIEDCNIMATQQTEEEIAWEFAFKKLLLDVLGEKLSLGVKP